MCCLVIACEVICVFQENPILFVSVQKLLKPLRCDYCCVISCKSAAFCPVCLLLVIKKVEVFFLEAFL